MSTGNHLATQRLEAEAQFDDSTVNVTGFQRAATVHRGSTTGMGHLNTGQGLYTTCGTALSHETSNSSYLQLSHRVGSPVLLGEDDQQFQ